MRQAKKKTRPPRKRQIGTDPDNPTRPKIDMEPHRKCLEGRLIPSKGIEFWVGSMLDRRVNPRNCRKNNKQNKNSDWSTKKTSLLKLKASRLAVWAREGMPVAVPKDHRLVLLRHAPGRFPCSMWQPKRPKMCPTTNQISVVLKMLVLKNAWVPSGNL